MRNCYFVIFNGRGWEKRREGYAIIFFGATRPMFIGTF